MPYIKQEERVNFDKVLNHLNHVKFENKGQLEYCIYKLMKIYMNDKAHRYSILHDVVYAAQHCADEFRRLYLDIRENKAKEENGDVDVLTSSASQATQIIKNLVGNTPAMKNRVDVKVPASFDDRAKKTKDALKEVKKIDVKVPESSKRPDWLKPTQKSVWLIEPVKNTYFTALIFEQYGRFGGTFTLARFVSLNRATRFDSEKEANDILSSIQHLNEPCHVVEHVFYDEK